MFAILKELDPIGVEKRRNDKYNRQGQFHCPGPNFVWSIDGHLKLKPYGIEIYAVIDAYSRYIVWIYVGISATTAVSVLKQFLDTVEAVNVLPRYIRSDQGTETGLIANAFWQFSQVADPDIALKSIYWYGTSTQNVRIESWWLQLTKGQLRQWRVSIYHSWLFYYFCC